MYLASGALTAKLMEKNLQLSNYAIAGGLSGTIAGTIAGILNAILSTIINVPMYMGTDDFAPGMVGVAVGGVVGILMNT